MVYTASWIDYVFLCLCATVCFLPCPLLDQSQDSYKLIHMSQEQWKWWSLQLWNHINNNNPQSTMGPELLTNKLPQLTSTTQRRQVFFKSSSSYRMCQRMRTKKGEESHQVISALITRPAGHRWCVPVSCWSCLDNEFHMTPVSPPKTTHLRNTENIGGSSCWLRKYEENVGWATKSCTQKHLVCFVNDSQWCEKSLKNADVMMESRLSSSYTSHQASPSWIKNPSSTMWRTMLSWLLLLMMCLQFQPEEFLNSVLSVLCIKCQGEKWETNKQTNKKTPRRPFSTVISKHRRKKTQQPNRRYSPPAKVSNSRTRDANILMTWWWCRTWWRKPGSWKLPKRNVVDGLIHQISTRAWMVQILTSNFGDAPKAFKHEDSNWHVILTKQKQQQEITKQHNPLPPKTMSLIMFHVFFFGAVVLCCFCQLFGSACCVVLFLSPALQGTTGLYSSASHGPLTKKVITGQKTLGGDGPLGQAFGTAAGRCSEKQS